MRLVRIITPPLDVKVFKLSASSIRRLRQVAAAHLWAGRLEEVTWSKMQFIARDIGKGGRGVASEPDSSADSSSSLVCWDASSDSSSSYALSSECRSGSVQKKSN